MVATNISVILSFLYVTLCQFVFKMSPAHVGFERSSYQADEGERFKEVCFTSRGSGFSFQVVATHEDNSTESMAMLHFTTLLK